jgi:hypothetical protein
MYPLFIGKNLSALRDVAILRKSYQLALIPRLLNNFGATIRDDRNNRHRGKERRYLISGKIRNAMLTITSDVITNPHRGGTDGVRATKYAAK